jgi:anti-sigma factor RsiW
MTRFRGQPKSKSERRDELLSAYLDGELSTSARARLEAQLASDPALRAELDVLRRTVAMVHDLLSVPAPHNFLLPVAAGRRRSLRAKPVRRSWAAPLLSAATAIVSLLFVAVLAGDLLLFGVGGMASLSPAEPMYQLEAPREAPAPLAPSQEVVVEAETVVEAVPEVEGEARAGEADEPEAMLAEPSAPMPAEAPVEEMPAVTLEVEVAEEKEAPSLDVTEDEVTEEPEPAAAVGMGGGANGTPVAPPSVPSLPGDEESADVPAVSPTVTAATRADLGAAEPSPGEGAEAEPTPQAEWEEGPESTPGVLKEQPEAGRISPRRGPASPWRVLEIVLGVSALVLALATIWAWRSRRH